MHGSDEEVDESPDAGSDEDLSDGEKQMHEEVPFDLFLISSDSS